MYKDCLCSQEIDEQINSYDALALASIYFKSNQIYIAYNNYLNKQNNNNTQYIQQQQNSNETTNHNNKHGHFEYIHFNFPATYVPIQRTIHDISHVCVFVYEFVCLYVRLFFVCHDLCVHIHRMSFMYSPASLTVLCFSDLLCMYA